MKITKNSTDNDPLILNGEELTLLSIKLNGEKVTKYVHSTETHTLTMIDLPNTFTLEIENNPSSKACTNRSYGLTCGELISGHAYIALGNRAYPLRL
jgi:aminopeptidase N